LEKRKKPEHYITSILVTKVVNTETSIQAKLEIYSGKEQIGEGVTHFNTDSSPNFKDITVIKFYDGEEFTKETNLMSYKR